MVAHMKHILVNNVVAESRRITFTALATTLLETGDASVAIGDQEVKHPLSTQLLAEASP